MGDELWQTRRAILRFDTEQGTFRLAAYHVLEICAQRRCIPVQIEQSEVTLRILIVEIPLDDVGDAPSLRRRDDCIGSRDDLGAPSRSGKAALANDDSA